MLVYSKWSTAAWQLRTCPALVHTQQRVDLLVWLRGACLSHITSRAPRYDAYAVRCIVFFCQSIARCQ